MPAWACCNLYTNVSWGFRDGSRSTLWPTHGTGEYETGWVMTGDGSCLYISYGPSARAGFSVVHMGSDGSVLKAYRDACLRIG